MSSEPVKSDQDFVTGQFVYLVVDRRGGKVEGFTDRDRAYEFARNTGQVVARLDVVTDDPGWAGGVPL